MRKSEIILFLTTFNIIVLLAACKSEAATEPISPLSPIRSPCPPRPTYTPYPTHTPYPTYTLYPTYTPESVIATLPSLMTTTPCPPFSIDTELPFPDVPENYVGLHFDAFALPAGLQSHGGFMVNHPSDYSVHMVQKDGTIMLWLERMICRDTNGKAYWEIRSVLILPSLQENEKLMTVACGINDEFDDAIIAIGQFEDGQRNPTRTSYAWRANLQTESFETLPADDVECEWQDGP